MTMQVTLNVLDEHYRRAQKLAELTGRTVEEVLADWVNELVPDYPIERIEEILKLLPDVQVLRLANSMMGDEQQKRLSDLIELNRSGKLDDEGKAALDELLAEYHRGNMVKGHAIGEALQRGFMQPIP